jgi:hypothetical protein
VTRLSTDRKPNDVVIQRKLGEKKGTRGRPTDKRTIVQSRTAIVARYERSKRSMRIDPAIKRQGIRRVRGMS